MRINWKTFTSRCGVEDAQFKPHVRPDDKDSSARQGQAGSISLIRVHHTALSGDGAGRICYDGVGKGVQLIVSLDVSNPAAVALRGVAGKSDQLKPALFELWHKLLHSSELGCADRSVVGRVADGKIKGFPVFDDLTLLRSTM